MIFLGLKGFGDFIILASYLASSPDSHTIIVRGGLEELANKYLKGKHNIIVLKQTYSVHLLYHLKNIGFKNSLSAILGFFEIRKILRKQNEVLVIDEFSIRNFMFFFGIKKTYLDNNSNLYDEYSSLLNRPRCQILAAPTTGIVAIFPFGSLESKTATATTIAHIIQDNNLESHQSVIYVHTTDIHKLGVTYAQSVRILNNLQDIIEAVTNAEIVLSVDTFQLHLAELYGKKILPLGHVNKRFIPPSLNRF